MPESKQTEIGEQGEKSDFIKYCEKASAIVQTWPAWKQNLLGTKNSSYELNKKIGDGQ